MLYVHHETSFDKFNENYDRIYRLEGDEYAKLPPVIGDYIKDRIPEIKNVVHLAGNGKSDIIYKPESNPEGIRHTQVNVLWADSTTFNVFTFPFIRGNSTTALRAPFKAVITESIAKTLFSDTDPMGKNIELFDHQFEVTGIIRDIENSHLEIGALVSITTIPQLFPDRDLNITGRNSWLWSATYLLTTNEIDENLLNKKINEVLTEIKRRKSVRYRIQTISSPGIERDILLRILAKTGVWITWQLQTDQHLVYYRHLYTAACLHQLC